MIGLALLLQVGAAGTATVGDTVWVVRTVSVAPGHTVRAADWDPADPVESFGRPRLTMRGTTAELRYPLTVWRAGRHRIEIPGPLVLGPNGDIDSLPPHVATLKIVSVLPAAPTDSPIAPQPRAPVVPRQSVSPVPLVVLWTLALILLLPLRWWWWRRGRPMPPAPAVDGRPAPVPVERWADAGEHRAVASLAVTRLRAAVEGRISTPDPALDAELRDLLGALDRTRFGSTTDNEALALARRAAELEQRLARVSG